MDGDEDAPWEPVRNPLPQRLAASAVYVQGSLQPNARRQIVRAAAAGAGDAVEVLCGACTIDCLPATLACVMLRQRCCQRCCRGICGAAPLTHPYADGACAKLFMIHRIYGEL
jgi:hypothetical protein